MTEPEPTDSDRPSKKQVNVRVHHSTYDEWTEVVGDDPTAEYRNVSELIRGAVTEKVRELQGESASQRVARMDADTSAVTDELLPAIDQLTKQVEEIDTRLGALEAEEQADEHDVDLTRVVYNLLPPASEVELPADAMSTTELIQQTGASEEQIKDAVEELRERRKSAIQERVRPEADDGKPVRMYYRSSGSNK